ncbi:pilus assembly protein PilP [Sulfitobacter mediterraneus]|uniref:pilus assembly protein PilP n=1 Tax=Sulfitobacter mediterraneus TaxID=83219 RepID=UPI0022AA420C|nr:pilus assembly protein PilP [Sulfitobacter mediterraneus]
MAVNTPPVKQPGQRARRKKAYMTSQTSQGQTPPQVAKLATEQVRLDSIAVIGIFGSNAAPGALIRTHRGKIERVAVGDKVAGGVVAAISENAVILNKRGKTTQMKLPQT